MNELMPSVFPVRPWKQLNLPRAVTRMKSMLSSEEKQYLTWVTAEKFAGWGAVVDLGPWLGSSSAALAEGLKRRGASAKIHSFDLFRWEPSYMERVMETGLPRGADFLPIFLQETADYAPWIDARKQDLMQYSWDGGPIEILFVDAAKSWDLANAIFRAFGPFLQAERSRIILQDFRYHETHWLPLIFDSRPDLWAEIEDVDEGHTVTFVPLKSLSGPDGIQADYSEETFSFEAAERAFRDRIDREEPTKRRYFLRMLYRKCLIDGPMEKAQGLREQVLAEGTTAGEMASIEAVDHLLVPRGWRAFDAGAYEAAIAIAQRALSASNHRSVHTLTLLGFSLYRSGDRVAARRAIDEVLLQNPHHSSARLLRAEWALAEARWRDAEQETLAVMEQCDGEEKTMAYAQHLLSEARKHSAIL
jgi:tetratricopeptide (TPR) repeat protein